MATLNYKDKYEKAKKEKKAVKYELQKSAKREKASKLKNQRQREEILSLRSEVKKLEKYLTKNHCTSGFWEETPYGHSYSTWLILIATNLQVFCGLSYRQVQYCLRIILFMLGIKKAPCVNTIRQWVQKYGKSELKIGEENTAEKILIMDESVGERGQEKALLFLGIEAEKWNENPKNLSFEDAMVTGLKTEKSWTGEKISSELNKVQGVVRYVVSDGCSALKKACRLSGLVHVLDCTHFMGNFMKKYHEKQIGYISLSAGMSKIRQDCGQSEYSAMVSPNMRTKAKFLNLFATADWLEKIRKGFPQMTENEQNKVKFVIELSEYVAKLICMVKMVRAIFTILKSEGITNKTEEKICKLFAEETEQHTALPKMQEAVLEYIRSIKASLPKEKCILCCSDLIESFFGKFKFRYQKNASHGITQDILSMPLFAEQKDLKNVKSAMESTSWADVNRWAKENLASSYGKTKRNFWKKILPKIA